LYVESQAPDARAPLVAQRTPGLSVYDTVGNGPIRGTLDMDGVLYVVTGTELYSVTKTGVKTSLGTVSGSGVVGMSVNDRESAQLMIVNGSQAYIYEVASGFSIVSDPDLKPANTVTYQDGYFITDVKDTGKWQISSILDGTTYDSTERGATNANRDNVLRVISNHQQVWVFGEKTIEMYFNAATLDFPFQRISEAVNDELGLGAIWSLVEFDNSIIWVGSDREVYIAEGYNAKLISDPSVSEALRDTDLSAIDAFTYTDGGHKFYQLNLNEISFVYDAREQAWHQRSYFNNGKHERHRARTYTYFNNQHVVGDYASNRLYTLSNNTYKDAGDEIKWEMTFPPLHNNNEWFGIPGLYVDIETGTQADDGEVFVLNHSKDAKTWSYNRNIPMGKHGEYNYRAQINRLKGTKTQMIYRLSGTNDANFSIYGVGIVS